MVDWILIIKGVLKFPTEVAALIRLLQKTPVQKKGEVMKKVIEEGEKLAKEGRPTWES